jgi:hypothetical protein
MSTLLTGIESIKFPFLGTAEDDEPFQYLLLNIDEEGIEICILDWFVNRSKLHVGNRIELFIPSLLYKKSKIKPESVGLIVSERKDEELRGYVFKISPIETENQEMLGDSLLEYRLKNPVEFSNVDFLIFLVKDCLILKQGINVYLKHLVAYFSRLVNYTKDDYHNLEKFFFQDLTDQVQEKIKELQKIYDFLNTHLRKSEEIPLYIELEHLREVFESEISLNLFRVMFTEKKHMSLLDYLKSETTYSYLIYINAMKNLEKRLYFNYNQIVTIYLDSLKPA